MYKLRIKISCQEAESQELVNNLTGLCSKINTIKNGVIIDPTVNTDGSYFVPNEMRKNKLILLIDTYEGGGFNTKTNIKQSQIVTGLSSKSLRPYFIRRTNSQPNGIHCYFSIPESAIIITATGKEKATEIEDELVTINELKIEDFPNAEKATITKNVLYFGKLNSLPEDLIRFKQACSIAIDKSYCEDCTHAHYFTDASTFNKPKSTQV